MNPLLSVVIPTKNRYRTLAIVADHLLTWQSQEFEVVIQDNSPDNADGLSLRNKHRGDRRLKYFHTAEALSATDNCQRAIDNAVGEFVCFIGDDDGMSRRIVPVAKWMRARGIDSVNCLTGYYCWPDYRYRNWGKKTSYAGLCHAPRYTGMVEKVDVLDELDRVLRRGALNIARLPRVYQGIVSKERLDALKAQVGTFFPGPVPDMASSVGLSFHVRHHVYLDYPLVIAGNSGSSMGGRIGRGAAHGSVEDEATLPADAAVKWSAEIPNYWAPKTIWPEAALQALRATGHAEMTALLNLPKVYAELYMDTPVYRQRLMEVVDRTIPQEELGAFKRSLRRNIWPVYVQRFRSAVKRYFVLFDAESLLGFSRIAGDTVAVIMEKLDAATDEYVAKHQNDFTALVRQFG